MRFAGILGKGKNATPPFPSILDRAILFATEAHRGAFRKGVKSKRENAESVILYHMETGGTNI